MGKANSEPTRAAQTQERGRGCGAPGRTGRAAPGWVRSRGEARALSTAGWQLHKSLEIIPEGSRWFSVGDRRLWQLAEADVGVLAAGGGSRGAAGPAPWPLVGWRWPRYPQPTLGKQPNCCSANYQMLLHWMEITLLSIQRTDNGLFSSKNTGRKGVWAPNVRVVISIL